MLGLDRERLIQSALETAGIFFLVLLVDDDLGERIELPIVAALISTYVLLTLITYVLHAVTRDWTRNDKLWAKKRKRDDDQERDERH